MKDESVTTTVYRISDTGNLVYKNDATGRWDQIGCSDLPESAPYKESYCGIHCQYFKTDGQTAVLSCLVPETVLDLEE